MTRPCVLRYALLAAAIISAAGDLHAQENTKRENTEREIAEAEAEAEAEKVADLEMEEVVVQGRYLSKDRLNSVKTPTPILNVPQSLSIISSTQITEQAFKNFGDVLRYTPGLSISQGEGHRDAIIIRGIQTTADFFVDGIRDDVQYYRPLYNVEQVEVLRGSNALLFGRGGGGGIINRVAKKPVVGGQFATINGGIDTFGAYSGALDANYSTSDTVALRINGYYQSHDNHRDFFSGDSLAVNPTLQVAFSDSTSGTLSYEYVDDDRVVDRGVPSVNVVDGPDVPLEGFDNTFFGSADSELPNNTTLQAHIVRARLEHNFTDSIAGNITAQFADYDKAYQNLFPSEEVELTNGIFTAVELDGYRDTTDRENFLVQANLVGEFTTGRIGHTLLAGFEFGSQDTRNSRIDNVFSDNGDDQLFVDFSDPLVIPDFGFTNLSRNRESEVQITSFYLQDQISLHEQLRLVVGLRYDEFDINVLDLVEQNDGDLIDGNFERTDSEVTPRFGLIYKPLEQISIYASYSETFLPRSGEQFLTLTLDTESTRPQFFENREIGLKWDINPSLSLTGAVFELDRESFTSVDPEDQGQIIVVEGSQTRGLEVQLTGNLTERWSISTGYAYLDGEVQLADGSGNDGNRTRQTPENMFSIWNNFRVNNRFRVALGATYQDSFFVREDNSVEVPSFTRVDAAAYYDFSDAVTLQLNVENLLDEDYFPDAHSNDNISTGKPLNVSLSVSANF